jgi:hypothetical protein
MIQRLRQSAASAASLKALFAELEGEAVRFPQNEEIIQRFGQRKIYGDLPTPRLRYVLEAIERIKRTKFDESIMSTVVPTVEHVMPQRWAKKWPLPNGQIVLLSQKVAADAWSDSGKRRDSSISRWRLAWISDRQTAVNRDFRFMSSDLWA